MTPSPINPDINPISRRFIYSEVPPARINNPKLEPRILRLCVVATCENHLPATRVRRADHLGHDYYACYCTTSTTTKSFDSESSHTRFNHRRCPIQNRTHCTRCQNPALSFSVSMGLETSLARSAFCHCHFLAFPDGIPAINLKITECTIAFNPRNIFLTSIFLCSEFQRGSLRQSTQEGPA